jgi:endonuclease I
MARLSEVAMVAAGDPAALEAAVAAELPFNCEHVVPQSWFGEDEPMRGDLHHLFACESRCNSFRGNTPFAEFTDFPESAPATPEGIAAMDAVRDDCGKSAAGGFEPEQGKGPAARAAFYFRLRYPDVISAEEMPQDRWEMLLTWH